MRLSWRERLVVLEWGFGVFRRFPAAWEDGPTSDVTVSVAMEMLAELIGQSPEIEALRGQVQRLLRLDRKSVV